MIPQRNLSLLANRLYKEHGGRRIPEALLERDYCLAWFLVGLSQSKLRDLLIFKGGTALKRCHFGDYRFSEDLDFTLARRVEFAEIRAALEEVYGLAAKASGIRFSFEAEDRQTHINTYTFYLRYQGPLPTSNTVKVDMTISEILLFPIEQIPVLRSYPEFEDVPEDCPISVYSLNEITTEKIVALQDRARNEPRDLYDLWFLTSHSGVDIGQWVWQAGLAHFGSLFWPTPGLLKFREIFIPSSSRRWDCGNRCQAISKVCGKGGKTVLSFSHAFHKPSIPPPLSVGRTTQVTLC